jgi:hypothetical protein
MQGHIFTQFQREARSVWKKKILHNPQLYRFYFTTHIHKTPSSFSQLAKNFGQLTVVEKYIIRPADEVMSRHYRYWCGKNE